MPTYNFTCGDCQHNFTIKASIQDKEKNSKEIFVCPKCKSTNIKQNFRPASYIKHTGPGNASCPTGTCPFMR